MNTEAVEERVRAMRDELLKIRKGYQVELGGMGDGVAGHGGDC